MENRAQGRRRRQVGLWPDLALALVLTVGGQFELALTDASSWPGALVPALLLFGQTAPVAVRRLAPARAGGIGAAALFIEAVATGSTNTLSGLVAGLVLIYSVGRWLRGARLIAMTSAIAVALGVHMLYLPGAVLTDALFAAIFSAAAWLGGRVLRRREQERRRAEADLRAQRVAAEAAMRAAVSDERARIARELHDVVAHGIGVMVVQAAAAEQMLLVNTAAAREPLTMVRRVGQGALAEMRRLLGLLQAGDETDDSASEPQPGLAQLPALVDGLREAGMSVRLTVSGTPDNVPVGIQLCVYRIVQEALTNSLKHAAGAAVTVALMHRPGALEVEVVNGHGTAASMAGTGAGRGLIGMSERAHVYGGTLSAAQRPDGGFRVHAWLPTTS